MDVRSEEYVKLDINVPTSFLQFLADTIVRLGFLYPAARFFVEANQVAIECPTEDANAIRRDLNFGLYRQKVYSDNLALRTRVMEGMMGK